MPPSFPAKAKNKLTASQASKKKFQIKPWQGQNRGEKIIVYGDSGMGKTTLVSLLGNVAFIGTDDGGAKIKNPLTGKPLFHVPDVETFQDVRTVLQSPDIFEGYDYIVIDTITRLESWAETWMMSNIPGPKGKVVKNIEGYGYNKGYRHLYDTFRLILQDCDNLVRRGKSVIFIAQNDSSRVANPGGDDFLKDGPRLYAGKPSNQAQVVEWVDHVFKIGYVDLQVEEKKASGTTDRVVYIHPEVYFVAKSRTISPEFPVVNFETPQDDTVWKFLFPGGE